MKNLIRFLILLLLPFSVLAANIDLQVSSYLNTPDPVVNGGLATFTLSVQNNGPATSVPSSLAITPPANVTYIGNTSGCTYSNPTLTCPVAALVIGESATITYTATGNSAGVQATTATITEATNTDTNLTNNILTKNITSIKGANLTIGQTGPTSAIAGSTISFILTASNLGPDPATTFQVVDDLPATVDFTYSSATGTGWSCSRAGTTLTCNYSGADIASGNNAPVITVTGQIITPAGSITNGVSVASTDSNTPDPILSNNGPVLHVVTVTAGTNLRANKTMVSTATGLNTLVSAEAVTLTLSATNTGTQQATGVTVTDSVPADFTIGTLPANCITSLQDITCTVGVLNAGATSASFVIPLTVAGSTGASGTNTANVTRTDPVAGTNTPASATYSVVAPFTHLTISKIKTPNPVADNGIITSIITVSNSSSSTAAVTGTVTVTDTLSAAETFVSNLPANGWSCSASGVVVTCNYTITGSIARGASLPNLIIQSTALAPIGPINISNDACTGSTISTGQLPLDNTAMTCSGPKIVVGTPNNVDLSITKVANPADPTHVLVGDTSFTYTLVISNAGPNVAPTVNVSDVINAWYNGDAGTTGGSAVITAATAGESCALGSTTSCILKDVTSVSPRTIVITLNRPFKDGSIANTATVSTPDAIDTNSANNLASANVIIDPIADVTVTSISDAPDPVKVGVALTYTTSIKNNGPSTAAGVVVRHLIDPIKMAYVTGSASLPGATCTYKTSFSDLSGAGLPYTGLAGIECTRPALTNGESRQLTFSVIPTFAYWDTINLSSPVAYTSTAAIITTTTESTLANNSALNDAHITADQLDIAISKQEAHDYDPDGAGPLSGLLYDPVAFGDNIKYLVTIRNNGPSLATNVLVTDIMMPPAAYTATYISVSLDGTSTYTPINSVSCSVTAGATPGTNASPQQLTCHLGTAIGDSILPSGETVVLAVTFATGGSAPSGSITYSNAATVQSGETGPSPYAGDTLAGNNEISETTTVLPKTDLYITKAADVGVDGDSSPYNVNEIFNYTLTIGNHGTSTSAGVVVTDNLPAGFVAAGNVTVVAGSNVSLSTNTCAGGWTGSCKLGPLPVDATGGLGIGTDTSKQVVITIPVRAAYPYTGPINTNILNEATIAPITGTAIDFNASNDKGIVNVQIRDNSIAGTVFSEVDDNGINQSDPAEPGISGVTLRLSGIDKYGNPMDVTNTTNGTGDYLFDKLPPSDGSGYKVTEFQPTGFADGLENAGGVTGVNLVPNSRVTDVISTIILPFTTTTNLTGYDFAEVPAIGSIAGVVWGDTNKDGVLDGTETTRIANVVITLTDTATSNVVASTITAADGHYYFGLRNAGTYTVTETQPTDWADGLDSLGNGGGIVGNDVFSSITVVNGNNWTSYDFGEIGGSIKGHVYVDQNGDGVNDPIEPGIPGVTITLTGSDIDGNTVNLTTTTGPDGGYSFDGLAMPNGAGYTITETQPAGIADGIDSLGTISGVIVGSAVVNDTFTNIVFPVPGSNGIKYDFGEGNPSAPGSISGTVWLDSDHDRTNNDGQPQLDWTVELIESRADPLDNSAGNIVVVATATTKPDGTYLFENLSPGIYEIRFKHPQGGFIYGTPLSSFAGTDTANGTIHGINLVAGAVIPNQDLPIDPSGVVYDAVTRLPVAGATVALTGPAGFTAATDLVGGTANLSQVTGATGFYQFLLFNTAPAGTYTLTVTSPPSYLPGVAGTIPACTNTPTISAAPSPALVQDSAFAPVITKVIHNPAACPVNSSGFAVGAATTQYYLTFSIDPAAPSGNVVNNHIPLDPILEGAIRVTKTTPKRDVVRGELVPYTITTTNTLSATLTNIAMQDQIPAGFKYVAGSATVDGLKVEPIISGRSLTWTGLTFAPTGDSARGDIKTFQMILIIGAGVGEGNYVNQVWANNTIANARVSNVAAATVRVVPDPLFDCSDIIGKVFDDKNINGYQDKGEPGLAGVRVVTPRGLLVTTDDYGRFHVACADVPNELHGSNFIMKLDTRTLPSGYRVTTENPRVVRLTRGKLVKLNFGAGLHRILRVDIDSSAFNVDGDKMTAVAEQQLTELLDILKQQPSQVRLSYRVQVNEEKSDAEQRMQLFADKLTELWQQCDCSNYALTIEQEVVMQSVAGRVK